MRRSDRPTSEQVGFERQREGRIIGSSGKDTKISEVTSEYTSKMHHEAVEGKLLGTAYKLVSA